MKKPLIGLSPYHNTSNNDIYMRPTFMRAISAVGGIPVVLPLEASEADIEQLAETLDGFLFTGGPDVHPLLFGEETHPKCGNVSPERDSMEMALITSAMQLQKPVLGVCRGIQLLNIALGGDIYQDLSSQSPEHASVCHDQPFDYHTPCHTVDVVSGSLLAEITGEESLLVNSMHHQAVRELSPCLSACAYAPGHLTEALEYPGYPFFLGVQWHPEYMWNRQPEQKKIFQAFVEACK